MIQELLWINGRRTQILRLRGLHPDPRRDLPGRTEPEAPDPPHQRLLAAGGAARRGRALQARGTAPARRPAERARPAPARPPLAAADRGRRAGPVLGRPRRHHPADCRSPAKRRLAERVRDRLRAEDGDLGAQQVEALLRELTGQTLEEWLRRTFFARHVRQFKHRPIAWHLASTPPKDGRTAGRRRSASRPSSACSTTTPAAATYSRGSAPTTSSR